MKKILIIAIVSVLLSSCASLPKYSENEFNDVKSRIETENTESIRTINVRHKYIKNSLYDEISQISRNADDLKFINSNLKKELKRTVTKVEYAEQDLINSTNEINLIKIKVDSIELENLKFKDRIDTLEKNGDSILVDVIKYDTITVTKTDTIFQDRIVYRPISKMKTGNEYNGKLNVEVYDIDGLKYLYGFQYNVFVNKSHSIIRHSESGNDLYYICHVNNDATTYEEKETHIQASYCSNGEQLVKWKLIEGKVETSYLGNRKYEVYLTK